LTGPGGFSRVLHQRSGRDADNIHQTYQVPEAVGRTTGGTWRLLVSDHAAADQGVLRTWSLDFGVGEPPANSPPVADAGPSQTAVSGATVSLSAARSSDPDGDALTFLWESTGAVPVSFSPSTTARDVTFVAPDVAAVSDLFVRLRVRDSRLAEAEAFLTVTVTPRAQDRLLRRSADTPLAIPDNAATGAASTIAVAEAHSITGLAVSVSIDHTWVGDLVLTLTGPGGLTRVLHNREGGSADDIRRSYVVAEAVGRTTSGTWRLHVADH
jgi:subtilisin-like proprotein convertase family protein